MSISQFYMENKMKKILVLSTVAFACLVGTKANAECNAARQCGTKSFGLPRLFGGKLFNRRPQVEVVAYNQQTTCEDGKYTQTTSATYQYVQPTKVVSSKGCCATTQVVCEPVVATTTTTTTTTVKKPTPTPQEANPPVAPLAKQPPAPSTSVPTLKP